MQASVARTGRARLAVSGTASTTAASPSAAHRDHIERHERHDRHDRHSGALGRRRRRHARADARAPARAARPRGDDPRSGRSGRRARECVDRRRRHLGPPLPRDPPLRLASAGSPDRARPRRRDRVGQDADGHVRRRHAVADHVEHRLLAVARALAGRQGAARRDDPAGVDDRVVAEARTGIGHVVARAMVRPPRLRAFLAPVAAGQARRGVPRHIGRVHLGDGTPLVGRAPQRSRRRAVRVRARRLRPRPRSLRRSPRGRGRRARARLSGPRSRRRERRDLDRHRLDRYHRRTATPPNASGSSTRSC